MRLPPPSKAQEKLLSNYYKATIWFDDALGEYVIKYNGHQHVGFGCDWYRIGKKALTKVSEEQAGEFNDFLSIFTRNALRKKKDHFF